MKKLCSSGKKIKLRYGAPYRNKHIKFISETAIKVFVFDTGLVAQFTEFGSKVTSSVCSVTGTFSFLSERISGFPMSGALTPG